ncbi:MAG: ABC transporter ATP-binding protein [Pseudomonadota bacterium]
MTEAVAKHTVISTHDLGKQIDGRTVLRDISVDVPAGEVIGIIGKNGAGKSTLFDLLLGFAVPTSGYSFVFDELSKSLPARVKARIGFVPQQDELIGVLTGAQQLALIASLHDHWDEDLIDRLAREWEVPLDRRISKLSGGERQKLSTLCALGHRPDLLVLDEPASSLDPLARRQYMRAILDIASDSSRTLIYATHIVSDLERVANRIWVLRQGQLVWQGGLDELKESVVRLRLRSDSNIDAQLRLPNQLQKSVAGPVATFVVSGWSADQRAPLAEQLGMEVEVELLGLEEIFLALHA